MQCPICLQDHENLIYRFKSAFDRPVLEVLEAEVKGWSPEMGACSRCVDQAQISTLPGWKESDQINGYQILPLPDRMMAHPHYTGKGVTICLIDSGFYPHPDLTQPKNRILAMIDITKPNENVAPSHEHSWHGTMTAAVCAGNGYLSKGKYRGLAPGARLVLIKTSETDGSIPGANIAKALRWATDHREKYGIRVINLSVSGDSAGSFLEDEVDNAVNLAVECGITVVAAAGNDTQSRLKAPANSPHALTIGGLNDRNTLHPLIFTLYHSTYGITADGLHKPELIAPAIWVPAPILPGTAEQRQAALLFDLAMTGNDRYLKAKLANLLNHTDFIRTLPEQHAGVVREAIWLEIEKRKLISPHYQHADGTSFAAPIACGVIAQMLEANPKLTPAAVREILLTSARKLDHEPVERQGYGVIHPLSAVYAAENVHEKFPVDFTPVINYRDHKIEWRLSQDTAEKVKVTGDFCRWDTGGLRLQSDDEGIWKANTDLFPKGRYRYKFVIDDADWIPDPTNLYREPDGFGGFNSQLIIEH